MMLAALWSPNVRELFYVAPGGALMSVRVNGRGSTTTDGRSANPGRQSTRR
jgi:hypothetical protein